MTNVETVIRLAIISHLTLASVCACAQPMDLVPKPSDNHDPMAQEIKRLVTDQIACFRKEALSKSIAKADLETAAYAVVARCVVQTLRLKAYSAAHYPGSFNQFEQSWSEEERQDLDHVKQMIALIRTAH